MTARKRWYKAPINTPGYIPPEPKNKVVERSSKRIELEQIEKQGKKSNIGTGAWRAGLRAKKALDEAYGEDRGA